MIFSKLSDNLKHFFLFFKNEANANCNFGLVTKLLCKTHKRVNHRSHLSQMDLSHHTIEYHGISIEKPSI